MKVIRHDLENKKIEYRIQNDLSFTDSTSDDDSTKITEHHEIFVRLQDKLQKFLSFAEANETTFVDSVDSMLNTAERAKTSNEETESCLHQIKSLLFKKRRQINTRSHYRRNKCRFKRVFRLRRYVRC